MPKLNHVSKRSHWIIFLFPHSSLLLCNPIAIANKPENNISYCRYDFRWTIYSVNNVLIISWALPRSISDQGTAISNPITTWYLIATTQTALSSPTDWTCWLCGLSIHCLNYLWVFAAFLIIKWHKDVTNKAWQSRLLLWSLSFGRCMYLWLMTWLYFSKLTHHKYLVLIEQPSQVTCFVF